MSHGSQCDTPSDGETQATESVFFFRGAQNSETICIGIACSTDGHGDKSQFAWTLHYNVRQAI